MQGEVGQHRPWMDLAHLRSGEYLNPEFARMEYDRPGIRFTAWCNGKLELHRFFAVSASLDGAVIVEEAAVAYARPARLTGSACG